MQTLRKKTSPLKFKNETSRFLGEGISFKAKLIGILEVSEPRGDRMCQEALSDLKMAIRAAGEHKQRIIINITIDGLRLRDEKTGDSLYHHPVHKISFIAQDMTDSRAFGYIFGSPETGHRFFGIKTDKAASQVVIAMRDLFQVVFALKKKEIELAKQNLEKSYIFNRDNTASFTDNTLTGSKDVTHDSGIIDLMEMKSDSSAAQNKNNAPIVANLVDLELELNNLQQGISQIEQLTPSDSFNSRNDPFGDSFTSYVPKPILPPPPSGRERSNKMTESFTISSPKVSDETQSKDTNNKSLFQTSEHLCHPLNESQDNSVIGDWFASPATSLDIVKELPLQPEMKEVLPQNRGEEMKQNVSKQFDVFIELDPLGTGKIKPYIHKKDFFQELKGPKKVLNDLVNNKAPQDIKLLDKIDNSKTNNIFLNEGVFDEDPFNKTDPFTEADIFNRDNFVVDFSVFNKLENTGDIMYNSTLKTDNTCFNSLKSEPSTEKQVSFTDSSENSQVTFPSKIDTEDKNKFPSESEFVPKPPPRPGTSTVLMQPPPLPPKRQLGDLCIKPPPRPPHLEELHYEINDESKSVSIGQSPPLPEPVRKTKPSHFSHTLEYQKRGSSTTSNEDDYLTPISLPLTRQFSLQSHEKITNKEGSSTLLQNPKLSLVAGTVGKEAENFSLENLGVVLSQLTLSDLNELAAKLNIPVKELSNMTLAQITSYLSKVIKSKAESDIKNDSKENSITTTADFADFSTFNNNSVPDKYAVFRELVTEELKASESSGLTDNETSKYTSQDNNEDKYAALREIVEKEFQEQPDSDETKQDNKITSENSIREDNDQTGEKEVINEEENILLKKDSKYQSTPPCKTESFAFKKDSFDTIQTFDSNNLKHTNDAFEESKPAPVSDSVSEEAATGTSPEIDITAEATKDEEVAGNNWTVFDQATGQTAERSSLHSEEGVSPWSSDSKEFGNVSPSEWKQAVDSSSDNWGKSAAHQDKERWWNASAELEECCRSNQRSTDSFEDECYNYSKKSSRPRKKQISVTSPGSQVVEGHSSSSRDVSPWEEEPQKAAPQKKDYHPRDSWERHLRHYFEKCKDSWDEDDDYEYDEEYYNKYRWPERHRRKMESGEYGREREWVTDQWPDERHIWKQEADRKMHCCRNWMMEGSDKQFTHYNNEGWHMDDFCSYICPSQYGGLYYSRDSRESPWEDDHIHSTSHYLNFKQHWKRPSSASEVDKKEEMRNKQMQYYFGAGGSDGEKERRHKINRRCKSRDAYYLELNNHHKLDSNFTLKNHPRSKVPLHHKSAYKGENQKGPFKKMETLKSDFLSKKGMPRKKIKDTKFMTMPVSSPSEKYNYVQASFENDFVDINSENSPHSPHSRFVFDYNSESSTARKPTKMLKQKNVNERYSQNTINSQKDSSIKRPTYQIIEQDTSRETQKSPFEDNFSPQKDKIEEKSTESDLPNEEDDYFNSKELDKRHSRQRRYSSNKGFFNNMDGLKKSESVNIFARENDPFDDDFFCSSTIDETKTDNTT